MGMSFHLFRRGFISFLKERNGTAGCMVAWQVHVWPCPFSDPYFGFEGIRGLGEGLKRVKLRWNTRPMWIQSLTFFRRLCMVHLGPGCLYGLLRKRILENTAGMGQAGPLLKFGMRMSLAQWISIKGDFCLPCPSGHLVMSVNIFGYLNCRVSWRHLMGNI